MQKITFRNTILDENEFFAKNSYNWHDLKALFSCLDIFSMYN